MPMSPPAAWRRNFTKFLSANSLTTYQSLIDVNTLNWKLKVDGELAGLVREGLRKKARVRRTDQSMTVAASQVFKYPESIRSLLWFLTDYRPLCRALSSILKLRQISMTAIPRRSSKWSWKAKYSSIPNEAVYLVPHTDGKTVHSTARVWKAFVWPQLGACSALSSGLWLAYHPVFESHRISSIGPAKLARFSSESGLKVYNRFGFEVPIDRPMVIGDVMIRIPLCIRSKC